MNEHRDKPYVKWGLTALVVIFVSILLVVIFTDLPGFFGVLTALEMILEPLGGGGNTATAGAQMKDITVKDALDELVAEFQA